MWNLAQRLRRAARRRQTRVVPPTANRSAAIGIPVDDHEEQESVSDADELEDNLLALNDFPYGVGRALEQIVEGQRDIYLECNDGRALGDAGTQALAEALAESTALESLAILVYRLDAQGIEALARGLIMNRSLASLTLCSNGLGDSGALALALPIAQSATLTAINLSDSRIGDAGAQALANALGQNHALQVLTLSSNVIGTSGAQALARALAGHAALATCSLGSNMIGDVGAEAFAEALAQNHSLRELDLSSNSICAAGAKALAGALAQNVTLTTLVLSRNSIKDDGALSLAEALAKNASLTLMPLNNNGINSEGAKALAQGLAQNSTLTEINLASNSIGDEGAQALAKSIAQHPALKIVVLQNAKVGNEGAQALFQAATECKTLGTLDLSENSAIDNLGTEAFAKAMSPPCALVMLSLQGMRLCSAEAQALADVMSGESSLQTLNLDSAKLDTVSAEAIAIALEENTSITSLSLRANNFGPRGTQAIGRALLKNAALSTLDLGQNNIDMSAAQVLCEALQQNRTLSKLGLGDNAIGTEGFKLLARGLASNVSLKSLCLHKTNIDDTAAEALTEALARNTTLRELNLGSNKLGPQCAVALAEVLSGTNALQVLDIENNEFDLKGEATLARLLEKNRTLISIKGLQRLPTGLEWADLWSCRSGQRGHGGVERRPLSPSERADMICYTIFADNQGTWSTFAHALARQDAHIFAVFLYLAVIPDDPLTDYFGGYRLWLQTEEGENIPEEHQIPILHALLQCRPRGAEHALPEEFCRDFIFAHLPPDQGLRLMNAEDRMGRSVRSLARTNRNTRRWAMTYGTFLGRYLISEGPPEYESGTCVVRFATDVLASDRPVALKIMRRREQFDREIKARETPTRGCVQLLWPEDAQARRDHEEKLCLVMPRGSRTLSQAMSAERFAGRNLQKARHIAQKLAESLLELHESGRIHGDVEPRNAVRMSSSRSSTFATNPSGLYVSEAWRASSRDARSAEDEDWQLIDLDASAIFGDPVTKKVSLGYAAPEVARWHLRNRENADQTLRASAAMDVWGFGVLLYQLLSGTHLFLLDERNNNLIDIGDKAELMDWLALDQGRLERIRQQSEAEYVEGLNGTPSEVEAARDAVSKCLVGNPNERISMRDLLRHSFFVGK